MRALVILVFWWFAFGQAVHFGGIWQLRAHPMHEVTAMVAPDENLKGQMSREWDGTWVLLSDDGKRHFFLGETLPTLVYKVDANRPQSVLHHWRTLFPMLMVTLIAMMLLAPWKDLRRLQQLCTNDDRNVRR